MATGALLRGSSRIQTDLAGLTAGVKQTTTQGVSRTEALAGPSESGGLGYLFDHVYTIPVAVAADVGAGLPGPHGGTLGRIIGPPRSTTTGPPPSASPVDLGATPATAGLDPFAAVSPAVEKARQTLSGFRQRLLGR